MTTNGDEKLHEAIHSVNWGHLEKRKESKKVDGCNSMFNI